MGCFWVLPKISFEKIAITHDISITLHYTLCCVPTLTCCSSPCCPAPAGACSLLQWCLGYFQRIHQRFIFPCHAGMCPKSEKPVHIHSSNGFAIATGPKRLQLASLGNTLAKESIHTKNVTERSKRLEPKKNILKKNTQKYLLALLAGGRLYTDLSPLIHLAECWTKSCDFQLPCGKQDHPTRCFHSGQESVCRF